MCFASVSSWGVIFVDAEDAKFLREYVWSQNASYSYRTQYAVSPTFARQNDTSRYLHLAVLGIQQNVAHLNRNGLDNRRANLSLDRPRLSRRVDERHFGHGAEFALRTTSHGCGSWKPPAFLRAYIEQACRGRKKIMAAKRGGKPKPDRDDTREGSVAASKDDFSSSVANALNFASRLRHRGL